MSSIDKAQIKSIPKWPFFLGDGLMVTTAVLLALTNGMPLSPMLMFFCIFSVAWGCLLACAPFILEYHFAQKANNTADPIKVPLEQRCAQLEHQLQEALHSDEPVQQELSIIEPAQSRTDRVSENNAHHKPPSMLKKALHIAEQNKNPKIIERLIQNGAASSSLKKERKR